MRRRCNFLNVQHHRHGIISHWFSGGVNYGWAFELTPQSLKFSNGVDTEMSVREQIGSNINDYLLGGLLLTLAFIACERPFVVTINKDLERSIVVLPFEYTSPDKSYGYFGDGIAEEILNTLSRLDKLVVVFCTSSFGFKDKNTDIR